MKFWVASVLIAAGDVLTRKKVLEKMIDLADTLCAMENGNMISFMAVMEGLAQPQVCTMPSTSKLGIRRVVRRFFKGSLALQQYQSEMKICFTLYPHQETKFIQLFLQFEFPALQRLNV